MSKGNIYYVDRNIKDLGDGKSFDTAFKSISSAKLEIEIKDSSKKELRNVCRNLKNKIDNIECELNHLKSISLWDFIKFWWRRK